MLIGQAPSRRARDFQGKSGARLAALAGIPHDQLARRFRVRNLLAQYPGRASGKGDNFPLAQARAAAKQVTLRGSVVLVGANVARAFGIRSKPFTWSRVGSARVAVIPHPSGLNLFWNRPVNVRRAARFLRSLLNA